MRVALLSFLFLVSSGSALAQPVAPGFDISVYSSVTDPLRLGFSPAGELFTGRDASGSGGGNGDPAVVHRIPVGGGPAVEYGAAIDDPDAVIFDVAGVLGTAGQLIVGGIIDNPTGGKISAVLPDESVVILFGPTLSFHNPTDFVFDAMGRLLFTNASNPGTSTQGVFSTSGSAPTLLFSTAVRPLDIAVDSLDRIFVSFTDGSLKIYDSSGALIDGAFATGLGSSPPMTIGSLLGAPEAVYTRSAPGNLLRIDFAGSQTTLGTGFAAVTDLAFGPDGALYIGEFSNDQVLRMGAAAVPALGSPWALGALVLSFAVGAGLRMTGRRRHQH